MDHATVNVQCDLLGCEETGGGIGGNYFEMRSASGTNTAHVTMVMSDAGYTIATFTADLSIPH